MTSHPRRLLGVFLPSIALLSAAGCSGDIGDPASAPATPDDPMLASGARLYARHCAECHGDIASSPKQGKSPEAIHWALGNIAEMKALEQRLTATSVEQISYALDYQRIGSCSEDHASGFFRLSRLTRREYFYAVTDLLQSSYFENFDIPFESVSSDAFTNNAFYLTLDTNHFTGYLSSAEEAVERAFAERSPVASELLACEAATDSRACVATAVRQLLVRAERRPANEATVAGLMKVFDRARATADFQGSAKATLTALLLVPGFLFKNHAAASTTAASAQLDAYQIASRLALLLWRSIPDRALLERAASGALLERETIAAEAQRMLADERARRFVDDFFGQWSALDTFALEPAPDGVEEATKEQLVEQTRRFFADIFARNAPVDELLNSRTAFHNDVTAAHYQLPSPGAGWRRQPAQPERVGYLGQASFLAHYYSPTARGKWILGQLMCKDPGDPPVVGELEEQDEEADLSFRQKLERHAAAPECRGCHAEMDPLGMSLENFDRLGRRRERYDDGKAIDSSGSLMGQPFDDYIDVGQILGRRKDLKACFAQRLTSFALARFLRSEERCAANAIAYRTLNQGRGIQDLLLELVTSRMFVTNAGKE